MSVAVDEGDAWEKLRVGPVDGESVSVGDSGPSPLTLAAEERRDARPARVCRGVVGLADGDPTPEGEGELIVWITRRLRAAFAAFGGRSRSNSSQW